MAESKAEDVQTVGTRWGKKKREKSRTDQTGIQRDILSCDSNYSDSMYDACVYKHLCGHCNASIVHMMTPSGLIER